MQIDFAENFALTAQDEIQSAHWHHEQVTVFTGMAWLSDKQVYSFAIISNYLSHDKYSVFVFIKNIVSWIGQKHVLKSLVIFSDGCAGQFKNRYTLSTLCFLPEELDIPEITWSFFATSHGKGAVDGVGANVKRKVGPTIRYVNRSIERSWSVFSSRTYIM